MENPAWLLRCSNGPLGNKKLCVPLQVITFPTDSPRGGRKQTSERERERARRRETTEEENEKAELRVSPQESARDRLELWSRSGGKQGR